MSLSQELHILIFRIKAKSHVTRDKVTMKLNIKIDGFNFILLNLNIFLIPINIDYVSFNPSKIFGLF